MIRIDNLHISDLKAFERRLTEVIACLGPSTKRWRLVLAFISMCTSIGAFYWLTDPETSNCSFCQSLWNHPFFTISSCILSEFFYSYWTVGTLWKILDSQPCPYMAEFFFYINKCSKCLYSIFQKSPLQFYFVFLYIEQDFPIPFFFSFSNIFFSNRGFWWSFPRTSHGSWRLF